MARNDHANLQYSRRSGLSRLAFAGQKVADGIMMAVRSAVHRVACVAILLSLFLAIGSGARPK